MAPSLADRPSPATLAASSRPKRSNDVVDFPFGSAPGDISSVAGTVYGPGQVLVQQAAYSVSDTLFAYSPETFNLDDGLVAWNESRQSNGSGAVPRLVQLQSRPGAGSLLLGYVYGGVEGDKPAPQTVVGSTGTLPYMQPVLAQLAFRPSSARPVVLNLAAVDYSSTGRIVTDYVTPITTAKDVGLGLVVSDGGAEAQAVTVLATALSSILPTIHTYDGVSAARVSVKTAKVLSSAQIGSAYAAISEDLIEFAAASKLSLAAKVTAIFSRVNAQLKANLQPFEYTGPQDAEVVVVSFGSAESKLAAEAAAVATAQGSNVGSLAVRLYSPFLEQEFFSALPKSTKKLIVLGQATASDAHSQLYLDISSAIFMKYGGAEGPVVSESKYGESLDLTDLYAVLSVAPAEPEGAKYLFFDSDGASTKNAAGSIALALSFDHANSVSYVTKYANQVQMGIVESQLLVSNSGAQSLDIQQADVVFVANTAVLSAVDVAERVKTGGSIVVAAKNIGDIEKAAGESELRAKIAAKKIALFTIDFDAIGENPETRGRTHNLSLQIAFWDLFKPADLTIDQVTSKIVHSNGQTTEPIAATIVNLIEKVRAKGVKKVEYPVDEWKSTGSTVSLPATVSLDSFVKNDRLEPEEVKPADETWVDVAKKVAFADSFASRSELRPDQPTKTFVSKVKTNQRVTPAEYNRHIFHLELDVAGTGLKYAIGEALGVHAPNNEDQVREFIEWYGANPDDIVVVPALEDGLVENKTVVRALRENLDLFGKPPKKFFESLARTATDTKQRLGLGRLAAPNGADDLKKRTEEDFITYVDILKEFTSARPPISSLVQMISPLKRREYSIASSQKAHPNEVHLLIVVVDWIDSQGRQRFGQCSKWLADLAAGEEVIVSVKPSVMKLPASPKAPIIMSGLGTGLAPFKAFLEEKAWQKAQGEDIGEVFLFLGSRHQREEYLYGELFEAYKDAGILTYIGAAFSRDQPQKIYIQDRIREAKDLLADAFVKKHGNFYLCGPTWPVADVSSALADIIATEAATRGETIDYITTIETLKEEERYILEVY